MAGWCERTLVVITADHGETHVNRRGNRHYWFGHANAHEETARVLSYVN
jgi:arylsulfatase A-like enzyme